MKIVMALMLSCALILPAFAADNEKEQERVRKSPARF